MNAYCDNFVDYYCIDNIKFFLNKKGIIGNARINDYINMFLKNIAEKYKLQNDVVKFGHNDIDHIVKNLQSEIINYENNIIKSSLYSFFDEKNKEKELTDFQKENLEKNSKVNKDLIKNNKVKKTSLENIENILKDVSMLLETINESINNSSDYSNKLIKTLLNIYKIYPEDFHLLTKDILNNENNIDESDLSQIFFTSNKQIQQEKFNYLMNNLYEYMNNHNKILKDIFDNKKQKKMINVNYSEYNDFINNMEAYEKYYKNEIKTILTSIIDYYRINPDGEKKNKKEECITILNENINYIEQNIIKS